MKCSRYSPSSASMICSSWPVPNVAVVTKRLGLATGEEGGAMACAAACRPPHWICAHVAGRTAAVDTRLPVYRGCWPRTTIAFSSCTQRAVENATASSSVVLAEAVRQWPRREAPPPSPGGPVLSGSCVSLGELREMPGGQLFARIGLEQRRVHRLPRADPIGSLAQASARLMIASITALHLTGVRS